MLKRWMGAAGRRRYDDGDDGWVVLATNGCGWLARLGNGGGSAVIFVVRWLNVGRPLNGTELRMRTATKLAMPSHYICKCHRSVVGFVRVCVCMGLCLCAGIMILIFWHVFVGRILVCVR